jgi:hypothetical protein
MDDFLLLEWTETLGGISHSRATERLVTGCFGSWWMKVFSVFLLSVTIPNENITTMLTHNWHSKELTDM